MHGEIFMFYAWQSLPCIYIVWTGWNSFDLTLSNIGDLVSLNFFSYNIKTTIFQSTVKLEL